MYYLTHDIYIMYMREQGVMADCVYCKYIRPELKGTKDCPKCHGVSPKFREAQMMDKKSSQNRILRHILSLEYTKDLEKLNNDLIGLLDQIDIYNFDFKDAIVNTIREIEDNKYYE